MQHDAGEFSQAGVVDVAVRRLDLMEGGGYPSGNEGAPVTPGSTSSTDPANGCSASCAGVSVTVPVVTARRSSAAEDSPLLIGAGSTTPEQLFPGTLDDIAYYPYALSAQQVGAHYTGHH